MVDHPIELSSESIARRNRIIEEHRTLVLEIRSIENDIERMLADSDSRWKEREKERIPFLLKVDRLIDKYWDWIPTVSISRCPLCKAELFRPFDPIDLSGFWWMDRTQRPCEEQSPCSHFNLLLGAVNLNKLPPHSGLFESRPGPDVPYVIPRILEMPTMKAVISSISMHCGYSAYPIVYYSEIPPTGGSLTQTWTQPEYHFTLEDGRTGWNIVHDSYDFDLLPWLKAGKVRWIEGNKLNPEKATPEECPYLDMKGMRKSQVFIDNELRYE